MPSIYASVSAASNASPNSNSNATVKDNQAFSLDSLLETFVLLVLLILFATVSI
jgi:hypothetical protein